MAGDEVVGFNERDASNLINTLGNFGGQHSPNEYDLETPQNVLVHTGSGVTARSGTTPGSGTVTIYKISSGPTLETTGQTITAYNLSETAVPGSCYATCRRIRFTGQWIIDPPSVTDLRLNGTDLELRRNCGWSAWHSGEECN